MNQYIIELILGLLCGAFLGITGIAPTGIVLLVLDYFNIGDYITNLGTILFINLFPITVGSVWEFYKAKKIDYTMGLILFLSIVFGGFLGSKLVVDDKYKLSEKTIKYITSAVGFVIGICFLISAQYEKK
jgi:uncharacterized membrane protein YfcA